MELHNETENIKQYLTPKSQIYYTKVMAIIDHLKTIAFFDNSHKVEINIFGGFIREIISHYFHQDKDFVPSADVDIWFTYYNSNYRKLAYSQNNWHYLSIQIIKDLKKTYDVSNSIISIESVPRETYGVCHVNIDGIKFDFNTDINGESAYRTISDFTVNNLTIDTDGNILKRVSETCDFNVSEIISQIKEKKLINIVNPKPIKRYINCGFSNEEVEKIKFEKREAKMLSYGYTY